MQSLVSANLMEYVLGGDPRVSSSAILPEHGFNEGSSIRKRNGVCYLVYAQVLQIPPTAIVRLFTSRYVCAATDIATAAEYHVSPAVNDANSGTPGGHAQDHLYRLEPLP